MKMKHLLLAAILAATVHPALAVPVTFTVGGSTFSTTITGANATRGLAWAQATYPTIPNPAYDPNCNPVPGPCAPATLPNPDPVKSALAAMWQGMINNIINTELTNAVKTIAQPQPI